MKYKKLFEILIKRIVATAQWRWGQITRQSKMTDEIILQPHPRKMQHRKTNIPQIMREESKRLWSLLTAHKHYYLQSRWNHVRSIFTQTDVRSIFTQTDQIWNKDCHPCEQPIESRTSRCIISYKSHYLQNWMSKFKLTIYKRQINRRY